MCSSHEGGNIDNEKYQDHILKKDEARKSKEADKNGTIRVVLLCPSLNASALYYKTKLKVHNFIVFDLQSKDAFCYLWHEAEGGLNADDFSSVIVHFIETKVPESELILYSDGCTYQNRNNILANALISLAIRRNMVIIQKFLERGHTQMECDSVHSTVEIKLRDRQIYAPAMYVEACETARQKAKPYLQCGISSL